MVYFSGLPYANAFDALRKIRHDAAHTARPISLADQKYQAWIRDFAAPWQVDHPRPVFRSIYKGERWVLAGNDSRAVFLMTAFCCLLFFFALPDLTPGLEPGQSGFGFNPLRP